VLRACQSGFWGPINDNKEIECRILRALVRESVAERKVAEGALRRQAKQSEHQALHDALTDPPNRSLFRRRIEAAVIAARATGEHVAVLLIDLDQFKEVNDTLGHNSGDALLTDLGDRLPAKRTLTRRRCQWPACDVVMNGPLGAAGPRVHATNVRTARNVTIATDRPLGPWHFGRLGAVSVYLSSTAARRNRAYAGGEDSYRARRKHLLNSVFLQTPAEAVRLPQRF
jgi:hypothetical protein